MAYKFKPNKSVAKRFKVSKTGKLKRHHSNTSHLMSARPANKRRKLRKAEVTFEGIARNYRKNMGISKLNPAKTEHEANVRAIKAAKEEIAKTETATAKTAKTATAKTVTAKK